MFWGLVVQPNKKYSKTVSTPFHVSQAVLDVTTTTGDGDVQLILKSDKVDYILCILRKSETVQVPLDLIFSEGDDISFRSVGGTVHLTGYLVDDQDFPNEVDSSDAEEEIPILVPAPKQKGQKGQKVVQELVSSSENENSGESQGEEASDDDDEEADNDSEEDDVEDSDDETTEPPQKIAKTNGIANGVSKKEEKHKDLKHKKQLQQTTEKTAAKTLQGGVKVEDLRVGQGAVAKVGKKVQVYYEGRFKTNNKIFDKTNSGKGFEFVLGRSEVIKGWDIGVQGMKAGGKRRIVCPPNMAYGPKGSPPAIPGNATLVFDVELRGVN